VIGHLPTVSSGPADSGDLGHRATTTQLGQPLVHVGPTYRDDDGGKAPWVPWSPLALPATTQPEWSTSARTFAGSSITGSKRSQARIASTSTYGFRSGKGDPDHRPRTA